MRLLKRSILAAAVLLCAAHLAAGQDYEDDAEWLVDVLKLNESSTIADIGAGEGELTLALSEHIGPNGHIYSSELGEEALQELKEAVDEISSTRVTVVEARLNATNLPEKCCDALIMRRVYHHIGDPPAMNASLLRSLKPGGRLAIIDFEPRGSESDDPDGRSEGNQHGVTNETVVRELESAGFTIISSDQRSGRDIYIVAEKPSDE